MLLAKRQILVNEAYRSGPRFLRMMLCSSLPAHRASDRHNTCLELDGIFCIADNMKRASRGVCVYIVILERCKALDSAYRAIYTYNGALYVQYSSAS